MIMRIVYPDKPAVEYSCDSIHLPLEDGDMGVRKGHMQCIAALSKGKVRALNNEAEVFSADITRGFAQISNDIISLCIR